MTLPAVPPAPNRSAPTTFSQRADDFLAWLVGLFTLGLGYGAGAGATVTQATSRTTGVTINAICGRITMVSAAGTTAWQSFVVTNSFMESTDTVIVTQRTGANLYTFAVKAGAGSFTLSASAFLGTATEANIVTFAIFKAIDL